MNLTDIRRPGALTEIPPLRATPSKPPPDAAAPGATLDTLRTWIGELCRLHQITVTILDDAGNTVLGPVYEPGFCTAVKSRWPEGCPSDCGREHSCGPGSAEPELFRCPYHLSSVAWMVRPDPDQTWCLVIGRAMAAQDQMSQCLEVLGETQEMGEGALATLGTIPWVAEPTLMALARFVQATLRMVYGAPSTPDNP